MTLPCVFGDAMTTPFAPFAPGFEFLQGLMKNAGSALPGIGQWVAPTLNPEELDKRIQELRTVQFWLEQNARMLGATIQALEVQKMTLSTLQQMNVQMGDLQSVLTSKPPADTASSAHAADEGDEAEAANTNTNTNTNTGASEKPTPPAVDPMQWWNALTQQFGELATNALKDGASGLPTAHLANRPAEQPAAKAASAAPKTVAAKTARKTSTPARRARASSTARTRP
jgi:hypothetical protein